MVLTFGGVVTKYKTNASFLSKEKKKYFLSYLSVLGLSFSSLKSISCGNVLLFVELNNHRTRPSLAKFQYMPIKKQLFLYAHF